MKRIVASLILIILIATSPLYAASNLSSTTCPGAGCVTFGTGGNGSIGIQITGTWVGTITFQGSVDGSNFVSISVVKTSDTNAARITTTDSVGVFVGTLAGLSSVRVVFTAYTSGTAVVTMRQNYSAVSY